MKNLPDKKYRVICYERVDPLEHDLPEPMSLKEANHERFSCECMDSENIYKIEEIEEEGEE